MLTSLKAWAQRLKQDVVALWLAARDPRTPWAAKLLAAGVAAYALSPIDLIPDFIPLLGQLDELVILPLGVWLAVKLVSAPLMAEFRAEAARRETRPSSRAGFWAVAAAWALAAAFLTWLFWPERAA